MRTASLLVTLTVLSGCVSDQDYGYSGAAYAPPVYQATQIVYVPAPSPAPWQQAAPVYVAPQQSLGQFLNDYSTAHRAAIGY